MLIAPDVSLNPPTARRAFLCLGTAEIQIIYDNFDGRFGLWRRQGRERPGCLGCGIRVQSVNASRDHGIRRSNLSRREIRIFNRTLPRKRGLNAILTISQVAQETCCRGQYSNSNNDLWCIFLHRHFRDAEVTETAAGPEMPISAFDLLSTVCTKTRPKEHCRHPSQYEQRLVHTLPFCRTPNFNRL